MTSCNLSVGRDRVVDTGALYKLEGPGIESRCGLNFPHRSRSALRATRPPVKGVPKRFAGG
jgi:hypothetical protein